MQAHRKLKLSFQAKVLLPVVALLVLLPAVTVLFVQKSSFQHLLRDARAQLLTVDGVFQNSLVLRGRQALARYQNLANDPKFRAVSQLVDEATMRKHLHTECLDQVDEEAELMLFANDKGLVTVARPDAEVPVADFEQAAREPIAAALRGEASSRLIEINGNIYSVTVTPVQVRDSITGVLGAGMRVGRSALKELASLVNGEAVFVAAGKVADSTLVRESFNVSSLPYWSDDGSRSPIRPVLVEGTHYLALASRFPGSRVQKDIGYVLLHSYEAAYQQRREAQAALWLICLAGVGVSTGVIWLLIGRITAPLRDLRGLAEAVGAGDFTRKVAVRSDDELGQLGQTFNEMTEKLRASRAELQQTVETLRATRAQLLQSEKLSAVGEFVAGVAHELNNPLTSVIGFAELLKTAKLEGRQADYLNYIVKSSERCHKIVQGLLSFARQHPPERTMLDVNQMLEGVLELLAYEMRTSNIQIARELRDGLPKLMGDGHQLQQVVLNILNNARQAIEANQPSGRILVRTEQTSGKVRIVMQDDGPGIKPENLAKIFDPFFTTKPDGKGTGLGLSLCYGIVREHGGTISAHSEPGKGATFVIELPEHAGGETTAESAVAPGKSMIKGAGRRALVIDDEDWIVELVEQVLKRDGFAVDQANDGDGAMQRVTAESYDLLVCDWKMPGLSGPQLFERIRNVNPQAAERVIFMTGDVVSDTFQNFLKEHSKLCLTKPFSVDELRRAVGSFMTS